MIGGLPQADDRSGPAFRAHSRQKRYHPSLLFPPALPPPLPLLSPVRNSTFVFAIGSDWHCKCINVCPYRVRQFAFELGELFPLPPPPLLPFLSLSPFSSSRRNFNPGDSFSATRGAAIEIFSLSRRLLRASRSLFTIALNRNKSPIES